jgi:phospholipid transport system substrate-binding protein
MPDATPVQKFDVIFGQPLTQRGLAWLMKSKRLGPAGVFTVAVDSSYPQREPDRMTTPVTFMRALALACAALTMSVAASAQAPAAPAQAPAVSAAPAVNAQAPAVSAQAPAVKAAPPVANDAAPVVRRESPAGFMKRVGNELLAASRSGSSAQFAMVLNSNADIPSIGISALGEYARSLPKNDRPIYYNGMINFIARYASKEAPKYPVARFIVTAQSKEDARGTYVDSRITLASGDGYDVRWLVVKRGTTYKVRDAQVIGFWMTSFLDNLFQSFISDNGGNPKALVVALNR